MGIRRNGTKTLHKLVALLKLRFLQYQQLTNQILIIDPYKYNNKIWSAVKKTEAVNNGIRM
jgi:conjugal transfer/entry exclusion protein